MSHIKYTHIEPATQLSGSLMSCGYIAGHHVVRGIDVFSREMATVIIMSLLAGSVGRGPIEHFDFTGPRSIGFRRPGALYPTHHFGGLAIEEYFYILRLPMEGGEVMHKVGAREEQMLLWFRTYGPTYESDYYLGRPYANVLYEAVTKGEWPLS